MNIFLHVAGAATELLSNYSYIFSAAAGVGFCFFWLDFFHSLPEDQAFRSKKIRSCYLIVALSLVRPIIEHYEPATHFSAITLRYGPLFLLAVLAILVLPPLVLYWRAVLRLVREGTNDAHNDSQNEDGGWLATDLGTGKPAWGVSILLVLMFMPESLLLLRKHYTRPRHQSAPS